MTSSPGVPAPLTPTLRTEIERWFVRRGVPQLIEGYSSEAAMDTRAAPWISAWLLISTIREWGTRPDWSLGLNLLGIAGTLLWLAAVWFGVSRLRGRSVRRRPTRFDIVDIATMAIPPAVPAALIHQSPAAGGGAILVALSGMGVIYLIVGFGLVEIGAWAIQRLARQLPQVAELVARTLPILLILVVFLLFATEIWEVAAAMSGAELAAVLGLMLVVAALLVVIAFRRELRQIEHVTDVDQLTADAATSPARPLADAHRLEPATIPPIGWVHRFNLTLLVAIPQLVQAVVVGAVVMVFLVALGLVALPGSVQEAWIGSPSRVLASFPLLDEVRTLSVELLTVGAVLGGFVGLYFSGLAISDPVYRSEGFDRAVSEVRQLLAARAVYASAARGQVPASQRTDARGP
jgi:hypothetical protein